MAFANISNQLIQIDTGSVRTSVKIPATGMYAGIGENQILGQRYIGVTNTTPSNPAGAPAIYMLVKYSSTGKPAPVAGPAPVYWLDNTFTTVTGVESESLAGLATPAGYLMANTTDISGLTDAMLEGAYLFIQVAGYLKNAYGPTGGSAGVGNLIVPAAGNWVSNGVAVSNSANGVSAKPLGWQLTAISNGLCDVLVDCDII